MKSAFTILELIFVIVILGILAAIALPRLGASKDEAEVSKALSKIKTIITDISTYALQNDALSSTAAMSNVAGLENVDLSSFSGTQVAKFKVGSDEECLRFVFVNESNALILGVASNDNALALITSLAAAHSQSVQSGGEAEAKTALANATDALVNADLTSTSQNKACVSLTNTQAFQALANKTYVLLGR